MILRDKYFETFTKNCLDAVDLTRRKNEGYTAGSDDPYSNFRKAADIASLPGETAVTVAQTILSRMADKISRYKSLTVRPGAAYDESMEDTLRDLMVYTNILLTWEQLGRPEPGAEQANTAVQEKAFTEKPFELPLEVTPEESIIATAGKGLAKLFNWGTTVTK